MTNINNIHLIQFILYTIYSFIFLLEIFTHLIVFNEIKMQLQNIVLKIKKSFVDVCHAKY